MHSPLVTPSALASLAGPGGLRGAACAALVAALLAWAGPVDARAGALPAATASSSGPAAVGAASADGDLEVEGLIVRLRGAATHQQLRRDPQLARGEATRWHALLEARREFRRAAAPRPVGRDQLLLAFERPMALAEAQKVALQLRERPDVEWAAPNRRERLLEAATPQPGEAAALDPTPVDPMFGAQWWLHAVGGADAMAPADRRRGVPGFLDAWASGLRAVAGEGAVVAVLDTGVTPHPELAGRLLPGRDMVSNDVLSADGQPGRDADPTDPGDAVDGSLSGSQRPRGCTDAPSSWHGTSVAGLLAAASDDGVGVAAALRAGRVLPVRVAGRCGATVADIVDGMRWAAGLEVDGHRNPWPARVVNVSFGGTDSCGREYQDTIDELRALGVVVVAAAGNTPGRVTRPASCRGVVGVVALNRDGFKAGYSGFGPELAASGVATVGGDDASGAWGSVLGDGGMLTLGNAGRTTPGAPNHVSVFGTSFAAPLVAATVALMVQANPDLDHDDLLAGLRRSARPHVSSRMMPACSATDPGRCICSAAMCGAGILDVRHALQLAQDPDAYTRPNWPAVELAAPALEGVAALGPDRPPVSAGGADTTSQVAAADGGGGALGLGWLALLALAVALLARRPRLGAPALRGAARRA